MPPTAPTPGFDLVGYFAALIDILRTKLAERGSAPDPLTRAPIIPTTIVVPAYGWLGRTMQRFTRLVAQYQAGKLPKPRPRAEPLAGTDLAPTTPPSTPQPPILPFRLSYQRLPQARAWLVPLLQHHAGAAGCRLRHMLAQPEMQALIAAAANLGRLVRPLAHALNVPRPPSLQRPKRVRRPSPRRPRPAAKPAAPVYRDAPSRRIPKAWLPGQYRPFKPGQLGPGAGRAPGSEPGDSRRVRIKTA
jgi:hypothetical protein